MLKKIGYKITEKPFIYTDYYILKINENEIKMNKKEVIRMANTLSEEIQKKTNIDFDQIQIPNFANSKITNNQHLLFILTIISVGFGTVFLIYLVSFLLKLIR